MKRLLIFAASLALGLIHPWVPVVVAGGEQPLWESRASLLELSRTTTITQQIPETDPQPVGTWGGGTAMNLSTRALKISLWGSPERLTLSVNKTDVWDRRTYQEPVLPLRHFVDLFTSKNAPTERYPNYYQSHHAYDSPCPKPVGQVILMSDDFNGVATPTGVTDVSDGSTTVNLSANGKTGTVTYLPLMERNVIAIRGEFSELDHPLKIRLYRHRDTGEYGMAMNAYGSPVPRVRVGYDYAKDKNNGPIDPPESGSDGGVFWIRQRLPGEITFPDGFEYVMAARVIGEKANIQTVNGERDLGTKAHLRPDQRRHIEEKTDLDNKMPSYSLIRSATGSAATAEIGNGHRSNLEITILVAVATSAEADNPLAAAKKLIRKAAAEGFEGLRKENGRFFQSLYNRREAGRIFTLDSEREIESIRQTFRSWTDQHQGMTAPDPKRYEADAKYGYMEQDWAPWHGLPCYDELYFTPAQVRNRTDRMGYYYNLMEMWLPACRLNARETFDLPGAAIQIGYLPPIKPDRFLHTHSTWEFCMEIPAQVAKVLWERFDYGADEEFLAETAYPTMREVAIFYSHYAKLGEDGYYHVIPAISAEHWGWTAQFEKNRDSASALAMFRWILDTTADASEILGLDTELRARWREIADRMAPFPVFESDDGPIFTDVRDVNPIGVAYNWFAGFAPTTMADEINLDSPPDVKATMSRTMKLVKGWHRTEAMRLMGEAKGLHPEQLLNSRSGRMHLFPAVPEDAVVAFRDFQARGGFLVSAQYERGSIGHVAIEARRDVICNLMNPWPGKRVRVMLAATGAEVDASIDNTNVECLVFAAEAGAKYRILPEPEAL